jgi:hypothetical protein
MRFFLLGDSLAVLLCCQECRERLEDDWERAFQAFQKVSQQMISLGQPSRLSTASVA